MTKLREPLSDPSRNQPAIDDAATASELPSSADPILFTIGFVQKSAEDFFSKLQDAGVRRLIDIRLKPNSQLAGFAKQEHLKYLLGLAGDIAYDHIVEFAPSSELFNARKKQGLDWEEYERRFNDLLRERDPAEHKTVEYFDHGCLLCSEAEPHQCHRRLVAEYLQIRWPELRIEHL